MFHSTAAMLNHSIVHNVTPQELARANPRPRVIDVREPGEFNAELGHIPGAELVPLGTLHVASKNWSKQEPLVIACRSGARSARGAAMLVELGFQQVSNLSGGTMGYVVAGLPTERS